MYYHDSIHINVRGFSFVKCVKLIEKGRRQVGVYLWRIKFRSIDDKKKEFRIINTEKRLARDHKESSCEVKDYTFLLLYIQ